VFRVSSLPTAGGILGFRVSFLPTAGEGLGFRVSSLPTAGEGLGYLSWIRAFCLFFQDFAKPQS
jgi:hypothetical protein